MEQSPATERALTAVAAAKAAVAAANRAIAHQSNPVVLVIDDAEDNRDLYASYLDLKGYRVITATDGPDGLQMAREMKPDAVVLDLGLPIVDGWEVARLLRAAPATSDLCIIACTGFAKDEDQQRALDAGVDAYLVKPCDPEDLHAALVKRVNPPR